MTNNHKNIVRVEKNKNYTTINNTSIQDQRLSWKAKAIHVFMLSRPDDWVFYNEEMIKWAKDGKDAFLSGLKELKKLGYIKKEKRRNNDGTFDWVTVVYEVPQPHTDLPYMDNPSMDKPYMEKPSMENPTLQNTKIPSTNSLNTNLINTNNKQQSRSSLLSQIFELIESNNFAALNSYTSQEVEYMIKDTSEELTLKAFQIAIDESVRKLSYVKGIIRNWKNAKLKTLADLEIYESTRGEDNANNSRGTQENGGTSNPYEVARGYCSD